MTNQKTASIGKPTASFSIQPIGFSPLDREPDIRTPHPVRVQYVTQPALKQGVHVMAGPGAGKSRWLGRVPAWRALLKQEPLVVIDPTGGVIDNLLDKIVRLPWEVQYPLWQRIRYIDAGASDYVVPTPLYYRQSEADTLFAIANRLPSIFERQDPALADAPILGLNALKECAIYAGQIAVALGRQIDFVADLIDHPSTYKVHLREALTTYPELQPAVTYFRELMDPTSAKLREKRTGSFKNKLLPFLADPSMAATFAGTKKQLHWQRAIETGKTVLIDLRQERDADRRQFKMIWYLRGFTDYIKYRGMAGRGQEVMLIIDEITDMLGQRTKAGHSILAEDMEELITRLGRNFGVNVILAHQNLSQLDERMQNILMQMGTQLIGVLPNPDDALRVARQFLRYAPYKLKKRERVWMKIDPIPMLSFFGGSEFATPKVIDYKTIEFTPEEQLLSLVNTLQSLGRFRFMARIAGGEGAIQDTVSTLSLERLDRNHYPNEQILAPLRRQLMRRDGVAVATLLAKMRANSTKEPHQSARKPLAHSATMEVSAVSQHSNHHDPTEHPPTTPEPTTAVSRISTPAKPPARSIDESVWQ